MGVEPLKLRDRDTVIGDFTNTAGESDGVTCIFLQVLIRDLLSISSYDLRLLTGTDKLDEPIRWVHVTDLPDPSPYLRGGELILSSALWHATSADSERFVSALVTCGVRALGVAIRGGGDPPADLLDACARQGLPLLAVPDKPFMDLTEAVITRLMDERSETSVRSVRIEHELTARLAQGEGTEALLEILAREVGARCWVVDRGAKVLGASAGAVPDLRAVRLAWGSRFSRPAGSSRPGIPKLQEIDLEDGSTATLVSATATSVLVYETGSGLVRSRDLLAVGIPERYLALSVTQHEDWVNTSRTLLAELVARLEDPGSQHEQVTRMLETLGIAVGATLAFIVACHEGRADPLALIDGVEAGVRFAGHRPVATSAVGDDVLCLVTVEEAWDAAEVGSQVASSTALLGGDSHSFGVSAASPSVTELAPNLAKARQAGRLGRLAESARTWATHAEVGSHSLLLEAAHQSMHEAFRSTLIDPLERYDTTHHSQLVDSLRSFLEHSCSWSVTARELFIHVNTLRYRMERVEQLTGRSLASMADRVDLYLALRTRKSDGPTSDTVHAP